jgi:hypothetical protein
MELTKSSRPWYSYIPGIFLIGTVILLMVLSSRQHAREIYKVEETLYATQQILENSVQVTYSYCVEKFIHEGLATNKQSLTITARQQCVFDIIGIYGAELTHNSLDLNEVTRGFNE